MTDEQILAEGLTTAYGNLSESIMQKARAQAASNIMEDNLEQEIKLTNRLAAVESDIEEQREKNAELLQKAQDVGGQNLYFREAAKGEERVNKLLEERLSLQGQIQGRQLENINLLEDFSASGDLIVTPENVKVEQPEGGVNVDPIRVPVTLEPASNLTGFAGDPRIQASAAFQQELEKELKLLKEQQSYLPEFSKGWDIYADKIKVVEDRLSGFGNTLAESGRMASEELAKLAGGDENPLDQFTKKLEQTKESTAIFANAIGQSISQMAGFLTEDLAKSSSAYDKFAALIINTGMQLVSEVAQQAVKNIATKKAESTAESINAATGTAAALGPAGAFVLPALIGGALALVSSSFGKVPAFQDGGIVGGNSMYGDKILARVNSQELILNRQQQAAVWGQMNTGATMGQSAPIEIVGETLIEGDNLRVIYERNNRNRSRQT